MRAVRSLLDKMGPAVVEAETDALNLTSVPKKKDLRLDEFSIEVMIYFGRRWTGGAELELRDVELVVLKWKVIAASDWC